MPTHLILSLHRHLKSSMFKTNLKKISYLLPLPNLLLFLHSFFWPESITPKAPNPISFPHHIQSQPKSCGV